MAEVFYRPPVKTQKQKDDDAAAMRLRLSQIDLKAISQEKWLRPKDIAAQTAQHSSTVIRTFRDRPGVVTLPTKIRYHIDQVTGQRVRSRPKVEIRIPPSVFCAWVAEQIISRCCS